MEKKLTYILIPLTIAMFAIGTFWVISFTMGSVALFIPGIIISYLIYLKTFYYYSHQSDKLLTLYLLALAIQLIHFTEEYLTGFTTALPKLLGSVPYPVDYWLTFNMVAYALFILGGIVLYKRIKEYMIIPLFFILFGVLFNGIAHVLLSIYVKGYFPGLYTALIYLVLGPVMLLRINRLGKFNSSIT